VGITNLTGAIAISAGALRPDGMFDLVINGGGALTVEYARDGYLPAQRTLSTPWQDFVWAPDVRLTTTSGYTYAVELSADEAFQAGATKVTFDKPLAFYVENFLDFPVGSTRRPESTSIRSRPAARRRRCSPPRRARMGLASAPTEACTSRPAAPARHPARSTAGPRRVRSTSWPASRTADRARRRAWTARSIPAPRFVQRR
jgi:hypothetical protein